MRIKVVNAMAPFIWGGAEELAFNLVRHLGLAGHDATLLRLPFNWDPFESLPVEMARFKALRIDGADLVISLKFPTYLMQAENHTTWLVHQFRQAYELWGTPFGNLPDNEQGRSIRTLIQDTDNQFLGDGRPLFTISDEVTSRLQQYNGITAPPLRLPLNDPEIFTGGRADDYILAAGRVNSVKRQWLAVEAMKHLPGRRLIVAGPPETPADRDRLIQLVEENGLGDRVTLDLRFLDRAEYAAYVNQALAVVYAPYQEDAFGYVTMEAYEAGKPVVTATDSGGVAQLVRHEEAGLVATPSAEQIAAAMERYFSKPALAQSHGAFAREHWHSLGLNWTSLVQTLVAG